MSDEKTNNQTKLPKLTEGKYTFIGIAHKPLTGVIFLFRENAVPVVAFENSHIGKELLAKIDVLKNKKFSFEVERIELTKGRYKGKVMYAITKHGIDILADIPFDSEKYAQYTQSKLQINDVRDKPSGTN
jgi:hypothetical protein